MFVNDVDCKTDILDHLYETGVLDTEEKEEVYNFSITRHESNRILLSKVVRKSEDAYGKLLESLRCGPYNDVVSDIEKTAVSELEIQWCQIEVPSELSATSFPQQWHKPRGRKIKAQPVVSMILANPTTPSSERKSKPVFTEIPQVDLPGSSSSAILKLKEDDDIPLSYLLQENATTIDTRLGKVQTWSLLYFHLQHYEESQSADITTCGNTKFPIKVTNIIDDL
ncbi:unnamed protein product [Mytilus coruscus]|uniref:CARD domain-containing protein n=1 Tax=Mytilus coruscus TaxID=42192 RepID=A0A6J8E858_MYTCO|nr:unnamed protein product [Mytilus coruscus]